MKIIFCAVILCLIATTYSFTLRKATNGLIRKARSASSSGSSEDPEFDRMLEEVLMVVKAKCDATSGDEAAFAHLMDGASAFVDCANSTIESLPDAESDEDESSEVSIEDIKRLFQVACPLQQQLFKCLTEFSKVSNGCLTEEERETKDNLLGVVSGVADYACENDGERVISFIENDGVDCINNTLISGDDVCQEKAKEIVDEDFSFLQSEPSCNSFSEERSCIIEHIQKCNKPKITEIIDGLFNVVWTSTSCKKFRALPEITSNAL